MARGTGSRNVRPDRRADTPVAPVRHENKQQQQRGELACPRGFAAARGGPPGRRDRGDPVVRNGDNGTVLHGPRRPVHKRQDVQALSPHETARCHRHVVPARQEAGKRLEFNELEITRSLYKFTPIYHSMRCKLPIGAFNETAHSIIIGNSLLIGCGFFFFLCKIFLSRERLNDGAHEKTRIRSEARSHERSREVMRFFLTLVCAWKRNGYCFAGRW